MKALIAGGGIGGLAAALALQRVGWDVEVFEQAEQFGDVGSGIQIAPNGVKVLDALEVLPYLEKFFYYPEMIQMRDGISGREIFNIPIREVAQARYGAGYVQIHRADLVEGLKAALQARAPQSLQVESRVVSYTNHPSSVEVLLSDGRKITGDCLIGADGINSVIRAQMFGPEAPKFTGNVAWRSVVPMDRLGADAPPPAGCIWVGAKQHAVTTRIRAGEMANFVGVVEQDNYREEGWGLQGDIRQALSDFEGWHPTITTILEQSDSLFRWALFDWAPQSHWSEGRVALLGDACHPMLPSYAQGAVQAFEDAWVLSQVLSTERSIEAGFEKYFKARIKRTSLVQRRSAKNLNMFHASTPIDRLMTYAPMMVAAKIMPSVFYKKQDWLWGYDATENSDE